MLLLTNLVVVTSFFHSTFNCDFDVRVMKQFGLIKCIKLVDLV